jgi:hypothetical protein
MIYLGIPEYLHDPGNISHLMVQGSSPEDPGKSGQGHQGMSPFPRTGFSFWYPSYPVLIFNRTLMLIYAG